MSGRDDGSGSSMYLIRACNPREYLELSGTVKWPFWIANDDSPNGNVKKQSLYSKQPSAQMSDFVVILLPEYKSIISGERYANVVYFLISSSTMARTDDDEIWFTS